MIFGFTCGAFDLLHAGHVVMLRECKMHCDWLIVGLHTDPSIDRSYKNRPLQTTYERYLQLVTCMYVDKIIPYDTEKDLVNLLAIEHINIRFLGNDYNYQDDITGKEICAERGIKTSFLPRLHNYSSSELRKRISK